MLTRFVRSIDSLLSSGTHPAKLVCVAGMDQGRVAHIGAMGLTLGKGRDCDMRLKSADVSDQHAHIHLVGGRLFIEDLQSSGGLSLEGCKLPRGLKAPLALGMQFQAGSDIFAVAGPTTPITTISAKPMKPITLRHDRAQYDRSKRIAEGRQAVIYQCTHKSRIVVLKVLNDVAYQEPERRIELAHRLRYLSQIIHLNLVPIVGADTVVDRPFVVESFVDGKSIQGYLDEYKRVPLSKLSDWLQQTSTAIDTLHRVGVTHQMLDNHGILIDESNKVRVIMFDALCVPGVPLRIQRSNANLYQAPEVKLGDTPTPVSDVFSLGALAYHCVCGQAPIAEVKDGATKGAIPPLRSKEPNVPTKLEQVIARAMNLKPANRFASVAEFSQAIQRCRL